MLVINLNKEKTAFVVVPHQDDELNLIGNCISRIQESYTVYVIYSSIDSDFKKAKIRRAEAIAACEVLEIEKKNIIFMDYPDTPNNKGQHFFSNGDKQIINDLVMFIERKKPDIIIGTDFDYHSDHRMISIALESAIGIVVKNNCQEYRPLVLKGFCYETAFCGKRDYFATHNGETLLNSRKLSNPSFGWDNRVSIFAIDSEQYIWRKKSFKALKKHRSQYAILRAESILNADNVFWRRRTENLLLNNKTQIEVSSGNKKKLNDFLIIDSSDIITLDPEKIDFSKSLWIPDEEDKMPTITIRFDKKYQISLVIIHGNPNKNSDTIVNGVINIQEENIPIKQIIAFGRETIIKVNNIVTDEIKLTFNNEVSISEIEVFDSNCNTGIGVYNLNKQEINKISKRGNENFWIGKIIFMGICLVSRAERKVKNIIKSRYSLRGIRWVKK